MQDRVMIGTTHHVGGRRMYVPHQRMCPKVIPRMGPKFVYYYMPLDTQPPKFQPNKSQSTWTHSCRLTEGYGFFFFSPRT